MLLNELIASRRQVDRLLDQQQVLLNLVAHNQAFQSTTSPAGPAALEPPSPPQHPSPSAERPGYIPEQPAPRARVPAVSLHMDSPGPKIAQQGAPPSGNAVADVLAQAGLLPEQDAGSRGDAIDKAVLSHIQAALTAVNETDVLADLPSTLSSSSFKAPVPPRSEPLPPVAEPGVIKMVPQPELVSSSASLTGEAGELVPLPLLKLGVTSAFWIEVLQVALMATGHKAADEGFSFGPGTEAALKHFQARNQLPETGMTDAVTWSSLLSKLPQLRQDIIRKVALGTAAAVVEWGRQNAGSSIGTFTSSSIAGSTPSSGSSSSAGPASSLPASRVSSNSGDIASRADPVGVNFFSDIAEMAAEEAQELAEYGRHHHSSSSSSSSSSDEDGPTSEAGMLRKSSSSDSSSRSTAERGLPELAQGDDDIEWVSVLHRGLQGAGYYPSEEECEAWLFGEGTQEAVLTLQACSGLPETGVVDSRTWEVLLSSDEQLRAEAHLRAARSPATNPGAADDQQDQEGWMEDEEAARALSTGGKWPVLTEMEGGQNVQLMQLALSAQGFNCGEDDMQYWMFGSMTGDALRTFQACAGLKETGVCDERTWKALLRDEEAKPEDLPCIRERLVNELRARGEAVDFAEDITEGKDGKVWLLGEQRWEAR